jgi:hypothetical protein
MSAAQLVNLMLIPGLLLGMAADERGRNRMLLEVQSFLSDTAFPQESSAADFFASLLVITTSVVSVEDRYESS